MKPERREFDPEAVGALAREFADWRLGGCPGYGFHKAFKAKAEKVARRHGRSYGELWAEVHRRGEALIFAAQS